MRTSPQSESGLVLIVDDNKDLNDFLVAGLECHGIRAIATTSLDEARKIIEEKPVDIVLLDWRFQGEAEETSGLALLRFCKQRDPSSVVIVMTGATQGSEVQADALSEKADGCLRKPIPVANWAVLIRQWLDRIAAGRRELLPRSAQDILKLDELKERYIRHVVQLLDGNVSLAAEKLDMHRHTISALLKSEE